jgi:hypothetical protein
MADFFRRDIQETSDIEVCMVICATPEVSERMKKATMTAAFRLLCPPLFWMSRQSDLLWKSGVQRLLDDITEEYGCWSIGAATPRSLWSRKMFKSCQRCSFLAQYSKERWKIRQEVICGSTNTNKWNEGKNDRTRATQTTISGSEFWFVNVFAAWVFLLLFDTYSNFFRKRHRGHDTTDKMLVFFVWYT